MTCGNMKEKNVTRAIVFVNPEHLLPNAHICIEYALSMGYHVVGVVRGSWDEVIKMNRSGEAEVVVVAEQDDLPRNRTPRVEVVAHMPAPGEQPRKATERTHVIRRTAAG
jgi:hypothetical protein